MAMYREGLTAPKAPKPEFSPALKEIAGRLTKLSFRDMTVLARVVGNSLSLPADEQAIARGLLGAADVFGSEV